MLWFLYTAMVPSHEQLKHFTTDLVCRSELPEDVTTFCDTILVELPPTTHMIMWLSILLVSLEPRGCSREWEYCQDRSVMLRIRGCARCHFLLPHHPKLPPVTYSA